MTRSTILSALQDMLGFLQEDASLLVPPEIRDSLLRRVRELLDKSAGLGEALYVGIVGGTGVGKSTLINALAREIISQASDRRPFTDRAVVYRHRDVPRGLEEISNFIRNPDALHDSDYVKHLILLDLPDFDSVVEDNRTTVLKILPFVDAIVWVVSPEKYADSAFYEFLERTLIHRENFTFVLNKSDELVTEESADPHAKLKEVLGDLSFRLKHEAGVEQPRIFSLSAAQELTKETQSPILVEEFNKFRNFLMVRKDSKEIASIKTRNLLQEACHLETELNSAAKLAEKTAALASLKAMADEGAREKANSGLAVIDQEKRLAQKLFRLFMSEDRSISSVKWGMRLANFGRYVSAAGTEKRLEDVFRDTVEAVGRNRRTDLEKAAADIDAELYLTFSHTDAHQYYEKPENVVSSAITKASAMFAKQVESRINAVAGPRAKWTRFFQKLLVMLPLLVLAVKLSGPEAILGWLDAPSFRGALKIVLHLFTSIFGPEGLTGLVALLVCEIFLIWYLASRRIRRLERISNSVARSAIELVDGVFDSIAAKIKSDRTAFIERIESGMNRFQSLKESCAGSLHASFSLGETLTSDSGSWKS